MQNSNGRINLFRRIGAALIQVQIGRAIRHRERQSRHDRQYALNLPSTGKLVYRWRSGAQESFPFAER